MFRNSNKILDKVIFFYNQLIYDFRIAQSFYIVNFVF